MDSTTGTKKRGRFTFYEEDVSSEVAVVQAAKTPQSPASRDPHADDLPHRRTSSKGVDVGLMANVDGAQNLRPVEHEAEVSSFKSKSPRAGTQLSAARPSSRVPERLSKPSSALPPHQDTSQVPLEVFNSYRDVISEQLSAMMSMHREIMMELIRKDSRRDEQAMLLCRENADLVKTILALENENIVYRDRLGRYKE